LGNVLRCSPYFKGAGYADQGNAMIDIPTLIANYLATNKDNEDVHGCAVLERIAAERRAHVAVYGIVKEDVDRIWQILELCIEAEHQSRTFQTLLGDERDNAKRLQQHRQSVADLRQFIDRASQHPEHYQVDWLPIWATEVESVAQAEQLELMAARLKQSFPAAYRHSVEYYEDALDCITQLIELRQQASDDAEVELGVTRKTGTNTAATTAAIGWFAEYVEHLAGKPCVPQVATLAEVALGIGEVTHDRVRAARKRRI
jgi:hypothetical protein